ncbi:hypothetical protein ES703_17775 [subsurface metagenome]
MGITTQSFSGGLSYDATTFFIALANKAIDMYGELSSDTV